METTAARDYSDLLNPVMLKELRQQFHSKLLLIGLLLLALVLSYGTSLICNLDLFDPTRINSYSPDAGWSLFVFATAFWAGVSVLVTGLGGMFRYVNERSVPEMDVSNFISMSPLRNAWGKLAAALVIILYLYAICLPFFLGAYILGNITLANMALLQLYALIALLTAVLGMLLIGSSGKLVLCLGLIALLFFFGSPVALILAYTIFGLELTHPYTITAVCFVTMFGSIFFVSLVARLSPPLANRLLPLKYCYLACILADFLLGYHWYSQLASSTDSNPEECLFAVFAVFIFLALNLLILAFISPDTASFRVREQIPNPLIPRSGSFLLSGTWSGGLLLSVLVLIIGTALASFIPELTDSCIFPFLVNIFGYFLFYAALARFFMFFCQRFSQEKVLIVVFLICNLLPFLVWLFIFFQNINDTHEETLKSAWNYLMPLSILHAIPDFADADTVSWLTVSDWLSNLRGTVFGLVSFLVLTPWFCRHFRNFRKPTAAEWQTFLTPQPPKQ